MDVNGFPCKMWCPSLESSMELETQVLWGLVDCSPKGGYNLWGSTYINGDFMVGLFS